MTISTIRSKRSAQRAFSLVEIMIGSTLGTMILAGVLTTFLMLGRSGANAVAYSTMEMQTRRALEELSQDLRMASDVIWNSATSITLLVPDNYTSATATENNRVTYAYDTTAKTFFRKPGTAATSGTSTTLISNVSSFTYSRFDRVDNVSTSNVTTKRIQLSMLVRTTNVTAAAATNTILSASFILRNKPVN